MEREKITEEEKSFIIRKTIRALIERKTDNISYPLNIIGDLDDLAVEFPSLSFNVNVGESMVTVNRKQI